MTSSDIISNQQISSSPHGANLPESFTSKAPTWETSIANVALQIHKQLELSAIFETSVTEVRQLLECDRVLLYRFNADWSGQVIAESVCDLQLSLLDRVVRDSCFEACWLDRYHTNHHFAVENVAESNLSPCHVQFLQQFGIQANLVVPILKDKQLWGLLLAHHCSSPRQWQPEEISGLQQIALHLGIALHQALLTEQLQAAKATLEAQVSQRTRQLVRVNRKLETQIREQEETATQVQKRKKFLQKVLDSLFSFVGVMTPDGILIEANHAPLAIAGLSREDVIGKPFAEAYWWAYSTQARETIQDAIAEACLGNIVRFDIPVQIVGGELITIDFCLSPLYDDSGQITHLIPSGVNVTDRKQAESELRRSRDRLRQLAAIVEFSRDAIISKDLNGTITSWNRTAEKLFGYTAAEAVGMPVTALVPEERQAEARAIFQQIRRGKPVDPYETQRRHKNGQLLDVAITVSPVFDEMGNLVGASKIARDLSDRKRIEGLHQASTKALSESQHRFQSFMNHAPVLSWIASPEECIEYANPNWLEFIGQPAANVIGRTLDELFPPELARTYAQNNQQVLQSGRVLETIEEGRSAAGKQHFFLVRKFPVYQGDRITSIGGIAIDITEQKQTEVLLRQQAETLNIFYETSPLMMGMVEISDTDILHLSDNPATLAFFGTTADKLSHRWSSEVGRSPEVVRLWLERYRQSQQQQRPVQFHYEHESDSARYWLLATVSYLGIAESGRPRFSYIVQDLSQLKQLEGEREQAFTLLRDSEQRYASLVCAVPVGIFRTDANGQCLYANERWSQLTGISPENALGEGWMVGLHPEDRDRVIETWLQTSQTRNRFELEYRFQHPDGQTIWVYGQAVPEYDSTGQMLGYVGSMTDITERKQIETERLQAQRTRLELKLLENILDIVLAGYWDWDIPAGTEYLSPGFKQMFGYEDDELPNTPETWQNLIFPEDLPAVLANFECHVQTHGEEPYYNEIRYRHKDGSTVWVICSGQVIEWDDEGNPLRMIGCHIDISDRKQAELALQKSEATNRALIQAVPDVLLRMRRDGWQIEAINPSAMPHVRRLQQHQTLADCSVTDLLPREVANDRIQLAQQALATGTLQQHEYEFHDGEQTYYEEARILPLWDDEVLVMVRDITERRQVEAKLRNLSTRFELAVTSANIGIWEWSLASDRLIWDERMHALYQISPEEFTGTARIWEERLHPDDRGAARIALERVLSGATKNYDFEFRILWPDGTIRWLQAHAIVQRDCHGQPHRLIGVNLDVTDFKETTQHLQSTTEQLELFVRATSEGFWDWNLVAGDIYFSPRWKEMLGYSDGELENSLEMWESVILEEDRQAAFQLIEDYNSGRCEHFSAVQRFRHKNGSTVYVHARAIHLKDEGGRVVRMVGSHLDITQNQRQELALKESEARYRHIVETTLEGVWTLDPDGKTTFVNERMAQMLGYDRATMQGKALLDFMDAEAKPKASEYLARRQQGLQEQHSFKFQRQDGSAMWAIVSATPILDDEGTYHGSIGLITDITEFVEIQSALQTSEMQLSGILNSSLDGIMAFRSVRNERGAIVDFEWLLSNPTACEIVGRSVEDLIGQRLLDILPGNREEGLFDLYVQVVESGDAARREFHYNHDGIDCWFENISVKLGDGFAVTFRDVTQIKQSERNLQQANQQLEHHLENLRQRNTEMLLLSETSDLLQACRTIEEACAVISTLVEPLFPNCGGGIFITCASRNRLERVATWGKNCHSASEFAPHDCWGLRRGRLHFVGRDRLQLRCHHLGDIQGRAETLCIPMIAQGETLGLFYLNAPEAGLLTASKQQLAQTVAEQIGLAIANLHLRETLQNQSIRDGLTGLFNRRYLEEVLEHEIARAQRKKHSIGVVMLDVDRFKSFNDTYGHEAGDFVLQAIGRLLEENMRGSDVACRYGGEEMTLLFPETTLAETTKRVEEIRLAISHLKLTLGRQQLSTVTASLGVAVFPEHGGTGAALLQAADAALYRAKANGRNQVVCSPMVQTTD